MPKAKSSKVPGTKVFVVDTNVFMHDPNALFSFKEHDVVIPMMVLEELDNHKKGMTDVARNVRQMNRILERLVAGNETTIADGIQLNEAGATGRLFIQSTPVLHICPTDVATGKADNQIVGVVYDQSRIHAKRDVILVSKDVNMRIKARVMGLHAEDYSTDAAIEDSDLLQTGIVQFDDGFWARNGNDMHSWQANGRSHCRVAGPDTRNMFPNQLIRIDGTDVEYIVSAIEDDSVVLSTLINFGSEKNKVWGINARNSEQNFALNLLLDPNIDFVSLLGQAGSGKTLLVLAAALHLTLDKNAFSEIIFTRATVPVGEEIGFLPGTEEEKMMPWMGALTDNLEFLNKTDSDSGDWGKAATNDLMRNKIRVKSLGFMRGRTFLKKFLIIDEAQNLTPKEIKTLITRAGEGTKVVCLGNLSQIDTSFLTETTSGLTHVVESFKDCPFTGHVTLAAGERSRLSAYANDIL
jgi:PhoH-like ATPase